MKIINNLNSSAASRQSPDEYQPAVNPHPGDVIVAIRERYRFQTFPDITPGMMLVNPNVYNGGQLNTDFGSIGINVLMMDVAGDIVQSNTTDQAEAVLDDVAAFMEASFGYRVRASEKKRSYVSNMVVEFEEPVETYIAQFGKIVELARGFRRPSDPSLAFKRLAFGASGVHLKDQIAAIEAADFLIEQRFVGPAEPNRYFCSAPLRSSEHADFLLQIEEVLMNQHPS